MADRFHFISAPGANTQSAPNVTTSQMGDGYEERKPAGLNNDLKTYSLTYNIPKASRKLFRDFLDSKKGYMAFEIFSPSRNRWQLVIAPKWSEATHHYFSTFTVNYEEVLK